MADRCADSTPTTRVAFWWKAMERKLLAVLQVRVFEVHWRGVKKSASLIPPF